MKTTKAAVYPEQEYMVIDEDISADSGDTDTVVRTCSPVAENSHIQVGYVSHSIAF